jgi:hypothetical protein
MLAMFGMISKAMLAAILPYAIGAYAVVALFQLITLPVEYDASRRAKERLVSLGLITQRETPHVSKVLNAAALTYVAALVTAVLELLRLILIARGMSDDDRA